MTIPSEKYVTEQELNEKAVAPRVTLKSLEAQIIAETYGRGSDLGAGSNPEHPSLGLLTFCVLTLKNGFTVTGQSACASPENYDEDIGRRVARGDAIRQVWALMGYQLRTKLNDLKLINEQDANLGEALTRMTAFTLGNPEAFRMIDADLILAHFEDSDEGEEGGKTFAVANRISDEKLAEICYSTNKAYCENSGDLSFVDWVDAPQWQRDTCINGVQFHRANPDTTPEQSHVNWLKEKEKDGWVYGVVKDPDKKEHPCMVPYFSLPQSQQFKDHLFTAVIHAADSSI